VFTELGGFATTMQLLAVMTRQELDVAVKNGRIVRVWKGIYAATEPDLIGRLRALDLFIGKPAVACMGTAAAMYGFDLENTKAIHVLDPGVRLRSKVGLTVHQRTGAPLERIGGRFATAPAWTAVEVARELKRPRALATLDAALHSAHCTRDELATAVEAHPWTAWHRRGSRTPRIRRRPRRIGHGKRGAARDDRLRPAAS
jgi:hypothetical protein